MNELTDSKRSESTLSFLVALAKRMWTLLSPGGHLPEDVWRKRYSFLLALTWAHALIIALIGPIVGYSWELSWPALFREGTVLHTLLAGSVIAGFAALGSCGRFNRTSQASAVAIGLMTSSAVLVHLSGGYIELHFHFFVMLSFLALLQDWVPYLLAILYVALHHGLVGALAPEEVFNHASAINAPWTWAGIHAFFVLWSCVGSVVAWRFNEKTLDQVKKQAAELEEVNRLQTDFNAMISHDLRSPLTAVMSTANLMTDGAFGNLNDEQKQWLVRTQNTCHAMMEVINDFLDVSRMQAGKLEIVKQKIDLYKLIQSSLDVHLPLAKIKNVALTSALDPDLPAIDADCRRLEQVLSNLISNAIKFTQPGGEVEVGARRLDGDVRFWVKDTGDGIPADEISEIFKKYGQATSGKLSEIKGSGLGLVICKLITEAHGGKISVESDVGKGSTFSVELPCGGSADGGAAAR
jgi:signal transduction histidine kinase